MTKVGRAVRIALLILIGFLTFNLNPVASASTPPLEVGPSALVTIASGHANALGAKPAVLRVPARPVLKATPRSHGDSHQISDFGVAAEETAAGTRSVDEVLNGLPRGKQGFVRTVPDEATLQSTFEELTQGGTPTTWKGYGGDVFELPDATQIGLRSTSRSGGSTIDLRIPGQDPVRIHIG